MAHDEDRDVLLRLFLQLRDALAPLGVEVSPLVLALWRDAHDSRTGGLFMMSGEFNPHAVRRLIAFADELRVNTADAPGGEQQGR